MVPTAATPLLVAAAALALLASPGSSCPGSDASVMHASANTRVVFAHNCADVAEEILARLHGVGGWVDPHNEGTYTLLAQTPKTGAPTKLDLKRATGGAGTYTDKMDLSFAASGTAAGTGAGCEVTACSESQVTSYADFSTNYCNIRNLYCGSDDGCPYALRDLQSHQVSVHNGAGASHDASACVKSPTSLCLVALQASCGTGRSPGPRSATPARGRTSSR